MYIAITKVSETADFAVYEFSTDNENVGLLRLDKSTGESDCLRSGVDSRGFDPFSRAARALFLHWQEGKFPDEASWAT